MPQLNLVLIILILLPFILMGLLNLWFSFCYMFCEEYRQIIDSSLEIE